MSRSKQKGTAGELELVRLLNRWGMNAWRTQVDGPNPGDKQTGDPFIALGRVECKRRKRFPTMQKWMEGNYAVAFRGDREPWLVTLRLEDFCELAKALLHNRDDDACA